MYITKIKRGFKLLDKIMPEWETKINLDKLDMGDCEVCTLGQLFGWYTFGVEKLDLIDPSKYGFDCTKLQASILTKETKELIKNKRNPGHAGLKRMK